MKLLLIQKLDCVMVPSKENGFPQREQIVFPREKMDLLKKKMNFPRKKGFPEMHQKWHLTTLATTS